METYKCSAKDPRRQEPGEVSEERPSDSDLGKGRSSKQQNGPLCLSVGKEMSQVLLFRLAL